MPRPKRTAPATFDFPHSPPLMFVCPSCRTHVIRHGERFICRGGDCRRAYPIKDGIPLLRIPDGAVLAEADWRTIIES